MACRVEDSKHRKSLGEEGSGSEPELAKAFVEARDDAKISISDFEYQPELDRGMLFIAAPVFKGQAYLDFWYIVSLVRISIRCN